MKTMKHQGKKLNKVTLEAGQLVTHTSHSSNSGDRDQEDHSSKPAQANSL
jgi:hypothetical protein